MRSTHRKTLRYRKYASKALARLKRSFSSSGQLPVPDALNAYASTLFLILYFTSVILAHFSEKINSKRKNYLKGKKRPEKCKKTKILYRKG